MKKLPENLEAIEWADTKHAINDYRCGGCWSKLEFQPNGKLWRVFCPKCGDHFRPMKSEEVERMKREDQLFEENIRIKAGNAGHLEDGEAEKVINRLWPN